ncbi:MAG: hypothetical protein Q9195_006497 [Heterodermia aff. obscurata]
MSLKRRRESPPQDASDISTSPLIEDRKSTFVGLYSPTLSVKELQARAKTEDATHRIAAWRKAGSQRSLKSSEPLLESGYDDDGEKFGGKTVQKVMDAMDVQGAVVVARWYGGVMLGPVRFDHIRNCARAAISNWASVSNEASKRSKVQSESEQKTELEQTLRERDGSIAVLRGLLAEKKGQGSSQQSPSGSPVKVPDYEKLPLHVLKRLEEVRDATIGWILKGIEQAEKKADEK